MQRADWQRISRVQVDKPIGAPIHVACQQLDREPPSSVGPDRDQRCFKAAKQTS